MNFFAPRNHLVELTAELRNFLVGAYPAFVTSPISGIAPQKIPVFSLHHIDPDIFGAQLQYLRSEGYNTVTADEYVGRDGQTRGERLVMLTIDDGAADLWRVAYPLLKQYDMKAVAFVCPGETKEATAPRKTYDNVYGEINSDEPLCTWPELIAMADAIDVQSHSLYHWIIFTGEKVETFFTPTIQDRWPLIDLPITRDDEGDNFTRNYSVGTPFYGMDSRLSDSFRLIESRDVRHACEKYVAAHGDEDFFTMNGWQDSLQKVHDEAVALADPVFREESENVRWKSIQRCFAESRRILEERLNKPVKHFCFPFGIGGQTAVEIAAREGFGTIHYGVMPPAYALAQNDITVVSRIKDDYIFRLPGRTRRLLIAILGKKFVRRFRFGLFGKGDVR